MPNASQMARHRQKQMHYGRQAAEELARRGQAMLEAAEDRRNRPAESLADWLPRVCPTIKGKPANWEKPHLVVIREALQAVADGDCNRLIIEAPPRHGKSALGTVRFPVWLMERNPWLRIIVGCYNQDLAREFTGEGLEVARDAGIPFRKKIQPSRNWTTAMGGMMMAAGVGSGVTGKGANYLFIDDPVRDFKDVSSPAKRDNLHKWYSTTLYPRLQPDAAIVVTMARWHKMDLVGRLLIDAEGTGDKWRVIRMPAIAQANDELGRAPGEPLCPEWYELDDLNRIKGVLGSNAFSATYQQQPLDVEGSMFKRHWFKLVTRSTVPASAPRVRAWDKASTEGDGDFTRGVLMAAWEGRYVIEDLVGDQWGPGKRDKVMLQTAQLDRERNPTNPPKIWIEQEGGGGGKDSAEASVQQLAAFGARSEHVTGSKVVRADPFAAQCEAGNVEIVLAPWTTTFLDELADFPDGDNDDIVDACSLAFRNLTHRSWATDPTALKKLKALQSGQPEKDATSEEKTDGLAAVGS